MVTGFGEEAPQYANNETNHWTSQQLPSTQTAHNGSLGSEVKLLAAGLHLALELGSELVSLCTR